MNSNTFYKAGFIESWGRGYEKIFTAFDKENLSHPKFTEEQGGITAIIPREKFMAISRGNHGEQKNVQENVPGQSPQNTEPIRTKTEPKPNQNRTKEEEKEIIISLIEENPRITKAQLSEQLKIHESSVQRRLDALVKDKRLIHNGPTNGGSWEILK